MFCPEELEQEMSLLNKTSEDSNNYLTRLGVVGEKVDEEEEEEEEEEEDD